MPLGDRTGPSGMGPGTGRAFGYCYGFDTPGYAKGPGRGMGRGMGSCRGMGRGRGSHAGRGYGFTGYGTVLAYPTMTALNKEDEIRMLKSQIEALNSTQKSIEKRLEELSQE